MHTRRRLFAAAFLATGIIFIRSTLGSAPGNLSSYAYEDTRQLVALVEEAATLMEQKGESAFAEFGRKGSKWFSGPYYLFIYEPDGTCVFHPLQPDWVGKNMSELRDMNGKPMVQLVAQVGTRPEKDASDWVFYLWPDKTQLIPQWKSAYVRKVVAPSGKTYVIGSGVYDIKMERVFVEERVRMACDLLESQGKDAAFRQLRDPASPFVFLGTFVFVLDTAGHVMVDPAFPTQSGRDLSQFEDAVGRRPIQQILEKLKNADEARVQYLWPKPGASLPSRKLVYVRKAHAGDETFIVGSDFFLATPIWMKD